ncbi:MAG: N-6 DNA methylase [Thermoanaerobaculia bacterium]|nr:N-6 DNA methylase [Thermoanaerobaculia bacterium]
MTAGALLEVLEATGYLENGTPAPGVRLGKEARRGRFGRVFAPDASWRSPSALTVYFKYEETKPADDIVGFWRREIWNEGFAPLLWVVSPEQIELYNGFGRPRAIDDAARYRLASFRKLQAKLSELDALAGRLAMETGQFWHQGLSVDRKTGVDHVLLADLAVLERDLVHASLERAAAQALIGRSIFIQYLIDRRIVEPDRLAKICGGRSLPEILRKPAATRRLFDWLRETFNGDMFSTSTTASPGEAHLERVADFLDAIDPKTGQTTLFPYQFDVIPVELISSIYERFAHSAAGAPTHRQSTEASKLGVYYTRLPVVSLVLDEVMSGLTGSETVLDLTCGSGVFLVEALRRLVQLRCGSAQPSRELVRSTLYEQIFGVDISEAAVRVAAFSLYLAALELDPEPRPPEALKFQPLIGKTLLIGDAHTIETKEQGAALLGRNGGLKTFDVIVGNPPWSFKGRTGTAARRSRGTRGPAQPRGEGLDFVKRAAEFAHAKTRFGLVLSAMPFFSIKKGVEAAHHIVRELAPVTLVNLSSLRSWLFPGATMPAIALFARHREQPPDQITVVQVPWSPVGAKTHTFEITPSDIGTLRLGAWREQPARLKATAFGSKRDLALLDDLTSKYDRLGDRLSKLGARLCDGLILGRPENRTRDTSVLIGLDFLETDGLRHFGFEDDLTKFEYPRAQWPRDYANYQAPLLLIKEFFAKQPRAIVAVSDRDRVFTDAFFGITFQHRHRRSAHLLASVLSSALASWFFMITGAEMGLFKRRLFQQDILTLPVPDLLAATQSRLAQKILELEKILQTESVAKATWTELDEAVFDLYDLDEADRVVMRDGLFRASWEWKEGREESVRPAATQTDLEPYARTFLSTIDAWLSARKRRRMRAEIFDLKPHDPLRVVRFVLEQRPGPSIVDVLQPNAPLAAILAQIGRQLRVQLTGALVGQRELRVHGRDEVVIVKPAARRHWMGVSALEDADAVIAESIAGVLA